MISFRHVDISEISSIIDLLNNIDVFKRLKSELHTAEICSYLFGPEVSYKTILVKDDDVPIALCIYHYSLSVPEFRKGICIDLIYIKSKYKHPVDIENCLLQVIGQKAELECLSFIEMSNTDEHQIPASLRSSSLSKKANIIRFRVDDGLHKFAEDLSKCDHCRI